MSESAEPIDAATANALDAESEATATAAAQDALLEDSEQRLRVLPGSTDSAASFEFLHEDHTLGNALRYIISKNPAVEFCAYSIPHPSEPKMNMRIQAYMKDKTDPEMTVYEILRKGLNDLMDLCDVVTDKFTVEKEMWEQPAKPNKNSARPEKPRRSDA